MNSSGDIERFLGTEHSACKNLIVISPELKILGGVEIIASLSHLAVTQLRKE